ncbi:transcriptional adapter 2-alpha-like isoform X1 [Microplitis mediator]|uniref:transcriptional adapter 2-alpha-like isoform X1 n=1 Tax=Microplitis mediator TaxID=375433 RepID=UPI002552A7EC|nr:transcriptional adapter 2-alpha-like isoform X1 [Microplitis mediator]
MANPAHSDIIEEDAADLQFPKDSEMRVINIQPDESVLKNENLTLDSICRGCNSELSEPYIKCSICSHTICSLCFSNGWEAGEHENNHDYLVITNDFPLNEQSGWSAQEELLLFAALKVCGYGNWTDIAKRLPGRSPEEIEAHYLKYYIDEPSLPGLPKLESSVATTETIFFTCKLHDVEEPPRFAPNSLNSRALAGYNAARSDFEVNFDNHAEFIISKLKYNEFNEEDDEDYELGSSLQVAIIEGYNSRLRERERRKNIIREHGLIAVRRTMLWLQRYDRTITIPVAEKILKIMQLVNGLDLDYIMECLHHAGEIKNYIKKLHEFRKNGLKNFYSVPMYQKLRKLRREHEKDKRLYVSNIEQSFKNLLSGNNSSAGSNSLVGNVCQRKKPPPLEIEGAPCYDKLDDAEKELCSNVRILPESYLEFKNLLISENKKMGHLKLAQARTLLKIDVNKTRKIFDFLAQLGYITKHQ